MQRLTPLSLEYEWDILSEKRPIPSSVEEALWDYPPVLRQLFFNRNIYTKEEAEAFLHPSLEKAHDPWTMIGMQAAVDRILYAIQKGEKIAIYGDYDVDGISGTALLYDFLKNLGAEVLPYLPNRFVEGYGVRPEGLRSLRGQGVKLVITVDCGARANNEAEYAHSLGLDLIITDHHQPHRENPSAICMLNPKQKGEGYPYPELSGAGIVYKLIQALEQTLRPTNPIAHEYLDLVALGTIADVAPLDGENRILVSNGLAQLRKTRRIGLRALIAVSGLKPEALNAYHVGYILAPRLNAAGRLDSAYAAFELLTTSDPKQAVKLAQELDNRNRERQELTLQHDLCASRQVLQSLDKSPLLITFDPNYNLGVIGLVAAHLVETFYRPAIVATESNGLIRGSCRSIPEFHITQALDECCDLIEYHGGHAAAAGFTIRKENFAELRHRLEQIARREFSKKRLRPTLHADLPLDLNELGKLLREYPLFFALEQFQPTGYGNPSPSFVSFGLRPTRVRKFGKDQNHLSFEVAPAWKCIAFRLGALAEKLTHHIDLLYHIERDVYDGSDILRLNVRDLKPSKL
ncbi:MAG: single-stranded-DNA-specific exonuclease RecJ [Anaerolineales bacterium]|nr:single-stranded-DNA-specific exonuclease RecJ [Anaerolineales bacterium]MDW8445715.1 single-stranded-DNA-specific exonuclease RecJ [Anaerolineales bacterium]